MDSSSVLYLLLQHAKVLIYYTLLKYVLLIIFLSRDDMVISLHKSKLSCPVVFQNGIAFLRQLRFFTFIWLIKNNS